MSAGSYLAEALLTSAYKLRQREICGRRKFFFCFPRRVKIVVPSNVVAPKQTKLRLLTNFHISQSLQVFSRSLILFHTRFCFILVQWTCAKDPRTILLGTFQVGTFKLLFNSVLGESELCRKEVLDAAV